MESDYQGSGLLSLEQYEEYGHFSYAECAKRFGLGRPYVYLTARTIIATVRKVRDLPHNGSTKANIPENEVLFIDPGTYRTESNVHDEKTFHANADSVFNVGETIITGHIPRECWIELTVQAFDRLRAGRPKGRLIWEDLWELSGQTFTMQL
ncbi:hypothetical protein KRR26_36130 [Corallococcus sp. M34]|uniref:hypothetical protein n=1 Tax=Citreicoccus inhibens TaxID=2849499 RepID=UPI001C23E157|nr:hypothetical protein [Citreicoccus inhibens]MBU8901030.1 hypothetical protein [Citreicoccus inhibens]